MSSVKLLQHSAAGKEEKCNKFKFFASYHYIPISLSTVQLQQILNLTLSSFLGGKKGQQITIWEIQAFKHSSNLKVKNHLILNPQKSQKAEDTTVVQTQDLAILRMGKKQVFRLCFKNVQKLVDEHSSKYAALRCTDWRSMIKLESGRKFLTDKTGLLQNVCIIYKYYYYVKELLPCLFIQYISLHHGWFLRITFTQ